MNDEKRHDVLLTPEILLAEFGRLIKREDVFLKIDDGNLNSPLVWYFVCDNYLLSHRPEIRDLALSLEEYVERYIEPMASCWLAYHNESVSIKANATEKAMP